MAKLSVSEYFKVKKLISSNHSISVFSVMDGNMPGEIFVNDMDKPTSALIKTCECNLVAGTPDDKFLNEISSELDFWDTITPDTQDWFEKIPLLHKNRFIHPFKRRHYVLTPNIFAQRETPLPEGFVLEKVNLELLRNSAYKNADKIIEWAGDWGDDNAFYIHGAGNYIRNKETIVAWSLSDCYFEKQVTIGVNTDGSYRKRGFGIKVVSETVKDCFEKNYLAIHWLCVDTNRGSISIAEKLGFRLNNEYFYFCSYLPTENLHDISEKDWLSWAKYLEEASAQEPRLVNECIYSYMKANDVNKTIEIINSLPQFGRKPNINEYTNAILFFQSVGLCSNFKCSIWENFINQNIQSNTE